jgi:hypothetical protein
LQGPLKCGVVSVVQITFDARLCRVHVTNVCTLYALLDVFVSILNFISIASHFGMNLQWIFLAGNPRLYPEGVDRQLATEFLCSV